MSATGRHSIFPAQLVGGSTVTLRQLHNVTVSTGSNKDIIIPGGLVDPSAIVNVYGDPRVTLGTYDLATAIAGFSPTAGLPITGASKIQYQARSDGGTFEGSGAHYYLSLTKGWSCIQSVSASQDGPAECTIGVWPLFDGTNYPLVANSSASLTSTPLFTSKFYSGPVYVNSAEMLNVISVSVNFGMGYQVNREGGDVFARTGSIYTRTPSVSVRVANANIGATAGLFNTALPGTFAAYFWKGSSGGDRVASATTEHCKISGAAGVWNVDEMSVQNNDDNTSTVTVQFTGTISTSVAAAIGG